MGMFSQEIPILQKTITDTYGAYIQYQYAYDWSLPIVEYDDYFVHTGSLTMSPLKWMWNWLTGLCTTSQFITINNKSFVIFQLPRLEIGDTPDELLWQRDLCVPPPNNAHPTIIKAYNFACRYYDPFKTNLSLDMHRRNWGYYKGKWWCFDPFANEGAS